MSVVSFSDLDLFGLMTYDMAGGWDGVTGYHSALHGSGPDDTKSQVCLL